ncbi:MAG TPA: hypothetical protein VMI75_21970 [Polyangiaceae bacterium]|jgi:hypothetical protein|nr:hypothetical protein [Polyangiaceae bacterium]
MLFDKRDDGGRAEAARRVKAWVSSHAHAEDSDAVMVTELRCTEEGCPPIETVLALLRPGEEPRKWKVHKPIVLVTEEDVRTAIEGRHEHGGH